MWPPRARRPSVEFIDLHPNQEALMTWTKPKFEIVALCSEVTSYLFQR
jgi:coenzyme PQQ precursor peptide PqqA